MVYPVTVLFSSIFNRAIIYLFACLKLFVFPSDKQWRNYRAFPHQLIVIMHYTRTRTHTHIYIYIHIISTHNIIVDCIHVHNTCHILLLLLTIQCSRNKINSTHHMLLLMLTVPMYGQLQTEEERHRRTTPA